MTPSLPPGPSFISKAALRPLVAPAVVLVLRAGLWNLFDLRVSTRLVWLVSALLVPFAIYASVWWNNFQNEQKAKALGAMLPPTLHNRWPAGLDRLVTLMKTRSTEYLGHTFEKWGLEYGSTFNMRFFYRDRFFTTEPGFIKSILTTDAGSFEKGPALRRIQGAMLGSGVFNADGELWKFHRSMTRPYFAKDRSIHFEIFHRHIEDSVAQMKARFREGHPVDIQDVMSRFTLDSSTEFLFGKDVCSLSAGLQYPPGNDCRRLSHPSDCFADAFRKAQVALAARIRLGPSWPLYEFWEDVVQKNMAVVNAFVDPIVDNALKESREQKVQEGKQADSLLGHLAQLTDARSIIRDETVNVLAAARDTTATALTFIIYMLSQHPAVFDRLREEVLIKFGKHGRPIPEDLRAMSYLKAVINETLRLFTPVPYNLRSSIVPVLWPSPDFEKPIYVPGGTLCMYSFYHMHRRADLWGPDAEEFDPDRFLDERLHKYLLPNPFIFLPFNAGPRICLGQQFAYNEISVMLIRLAQIFSAIELCSEADPESTPPADWALGGGRKSKEKIWLKSHLTMYAEHGCWVKMSDSDA